MLYWYVCTKLRVVLVALDGLDPNIGLSSGLPHVASVPSHCAVAGRRAELACVGTGVGKEYFEICCYACDWCATGNGTIANSSLSHALATRNTKKIISQIITQRKKILWLTVST